MTDTCLDFQEMFSRTINFQTILDHMYTSSLGEPLNASWTEKDAVSIVSFRYKRKRDREVLELFVQSNQQIKMACIYY